MESFLAVGILERPANFSRTVPAAPVNAPSSSMTITCNSSKLTLLFAAQSVVPGVLSKFEAYVQAVERTAVAVAPEPPPPEIVTVGAEAYPNPVYTIVTPFTAPLSIVAVAEAVPPADGDADTVTVGAEVYPDPPAVTLIDATDVAVKFPRSATATFRVLPLVPAHFAANGPTPLVPL